MVGTAGELVMSLMDLSHDRTFDSTQYLHFRPDAAYKSRLLLAILSSPVIFFLLPLSTDRSMAQPADPPLRLPYYLAQLDKISIPLFPQLTIQPTCLDGVQRRIALAQWPNRAPLSLHETATRILQLLTNGFSRFNCAITKTWEDKFNTYFVVDIMPRGEARYGVKQMQALVRLYDGVDYRTRLNQVSEVYTMSFLKRDSGDAIPVPYVYAYGQNKSLLGCPFVVLEVKQRSTTTLALGFENLSTAAKENAIRDLEFQDGLPTGFSFAEQHTSPSCYVHVD
ncbi:hypothetical protein CALVIDRAFT_601818 [Calocera viscosa TUFC12733]|uniref:Uncharacterized protein n=1 Tax=Calocera viscosa (strain TUFC12733) TaxID=1330018 RepID=A0A167HU62_CALVF|nr:hypothetical protein CALVIDRAFT_601818 [Calocera viscosa TUFC12733]